MFRVVCCFFLLQRTVVYVLSKAKNGEEEKGENQVWLELNGPQKVTLDCTYSRHKKSPTIALFSDALASLALNSDAVPLYVLSFH